MSSRAQEYRRKLDELVRGANSLKPEAAKQIEGLLRDLEREIRADIAKADPESYTASRLASLKQEIDRNLKQFEQQASRNVANMQQKAYTEAALRIDSTVSSALGTVMVHPVLNQQQLVVAQGFSADLISGVSREASAKINATLQRAFLGRSTLPQLISQVDGILEKTVANRAIDVAVNETMRMHSIAGQARLEDLATRHPELGKQWKHLPASLTPRPAHLLADGQVRRVEEPFDVGGEDLMYPRDPAGSAENTINCHCLSLPHIAPEHLKATDGERKMLADFGLRMIKG